MKNFSKVKTIEYYYRKDGSILKENHFNYKNGGIKMRSYMYNQIAENTFEQVDENGVVLSTVKYNKKGELVERIINGKIAYKVNTEYCDFGLKKLERISNSDYRCTEYYYDDNGNIDFISNIDKNLRCKFIEVTKFGNQEIYTYRNSKDIYKVSTLDSHGNVIEENYGYILDKKEYNKKGLVTKYKLYSCTPL